MGSCVETFFDLIEATDTETGEFTFKVPQEEVARIYQLAREELGLIKPVPAKPKTLAEKIFEAKKDVEFYKDQLKGLEGRNLSTEQTKMDKMWWEWHLLKTEAHLAKLKRRLTKKANLSQQIDPETVKESVDIVEVVEHYVPLRRKGKDWWGLCPFHKEKTPSFSVNSERQFFHCFGCQESGDVFDFVQKIEAIDFPEALRRLANG